MAAYLFEDDDLPEGFRFPASFLRLMAATPIPYYQPWWFLTAYRDEAREWLQALREDYPSRVLIPFAKYGSEAEIACFDGADLSGNPVVCYVGADMKPGQEDHGRAADFDAWLQDAKLEFQEFQRVPGTEEIPGQEQ